jgi:hypothetical protein
MYILKIEAVHSSEASVNFTRRHISENNVLQSHFLKDGPSYRVAVYNIRVM